MWMWLNRLAETAIWGTAEWTWCWTLFRWRRARESICHYVLKSREMYEITGKLGRYDRWRCCLAGLIICLWSCLAFGLFLVTSLGSQPPRLCTELLCLPGKFLDSVNLPSRVFLDRIQSDLHGLTMLPSHHVAPPSTRVPAACSCSFSLLWVLVCLTGRLNTILSHAIPNKSGFD